MARTRASVTQIALMLARNSWIGLLGVANGIATLDSLVVVVQSVRKVVAGFDPPITAGHVTVSAGGRLKFGDGAAVQTVPSAAEVTAAAAAAAAAQASANLAITYAANMHTYAYFTAAAKVGNDVVITGQIRDFAGNNVARAQQLYCQWDGAPATCQFSAVGGGATAYSTLPNSKLAMVTGANGAFTITINDSTGVYVGSGSLKIFPVTIPGSTPLMGFGSLNTVSFA